MNRIGELDKTEPATYIATYIEIHLLVTSLAFNQTYFASQNNINRDTIAATSEFLHEL
jgi:hypothetical protein